MELDKFERKVFSAWAHITRAEDVDGCWVAYCPEFDVVSYGDSPQHAGEMIRDALEMVILDDLNNGLDPSTRRAEDAAFEPLQRLFERHEKVPVTHMDATAPKFREFAIPMTLSFVRQNCELAPGSVPESDAAFAVVAEAA